MPPKLKPAPKRIYIELYADGTPAGSNVSIKLAKHYATDENRIVEYVIAPTPRAKKKQ